MISLDQARVVIAAARAKGRDMSLNPLTVVVLDAGGHLVAMEREDGSAYGRPDIAGGKAARRQARWRWAYQAELWEIWRLNGRNFLQRSVQPGTAN